MKYESDVMYYWSVKVHYKRLIVKEVPSVVLTLWELLKIIEEYMISFINYWNLEFNYKRS